jgi:hypothetical protein
MKFCIRVNNSRENLQNNLNNVPLILTNRCHARNIMLGVTPILRCPYLAKHLRHMFSPSLQEPLYANGREWCAYLPGAHSV